MKTRIAMALAGAALAASAGTAVPALASGTATGSPHVHVLSFTATPTSYHFYNQAQTLGFEVDRDTSHGKVVASDIVDFVAGGKSEMTVALRDGFLYCEFTVAHSGAISGHITGGTAGFQGDVGTIGGTAESTAAYVIVTYYHGG